MPSPVQNLTAPHTATLGEDRALFCATAAGVVVTLPPLAVGRLYGLADHRPAAAGAAPILRPQPGDVLLSDAIGPGDDAALPAGLGVVATATNYVGQQATSVWALGTPQGWQLSIDPPVRWVAEVA